MGLDATETPKANGLKTALDTIIAPGEAFERLRAVPTWGWALLITIVLYAVGTYISIPALQHGFAGDWPRQVAANPQMAQMTPEQQQRMLALSLTFVKFSWLFTPIFAFIGILVSTIIMLIFKLIGKGDAPFRSLWAAAANIAVPVLGLYMIVTAIVILVRGPDSFSSQADVQTAMPSLALLVPFSAVKLHAFLAMINPFTLWGCFLMATAMTIVARVSRGVAWAAGIVQVLVSAGLLALAAR
jgi:hypothetical protein